MAKSWKDLTLEEAVERAKGVSRQALHTAIRTYTANGRTDIVEQLLLVRKTIKRDKRIDKVGKETIEAKEASKEAREAAVADFETYESRPVPGFEGNWSVTPDGRVWSHSYARWLLENLIRPNQRSDKVYHYVGGGKSALALHRAVALAYVPNPENRRNVRHKDGNTANNHMDNLEWWGKVVESVKT